MRAHSKERGVALSGLRSSGEGGFVLIAALVILAVLAAIVTEFVYRVHVSTSRASNFADGQKAALLAGKGVELAQEAVKEMLKSGPNIAIDKDGLIFTASEGGASVVVRVHDELGKASLRTVYPNGVENGRTHPVLSRLLEGLRIKGREGLEDALADWIDGDDQPRAYGAEGPEHYLRLKSPYEARNGYPGSLGELLMIRGFTPEVLATLKPFISPYNTDGLVNVNTATMEVLLALSEEMTEELASNLITRRMERPFRDRSEIMKVPGFEDAGYGLMDGIRVESRIFSVHSNAASGEVSREIEAVFEAGKGVLYWRRL
ncbi:MAG: type II secretion system minor pseudopilin GspK [Deltaproteobacteria bacterium]|nr:type II secretion system minor pseudopilin GspK [Deltaproteobacteria bacterium]MCL4874182.1 type II secretion system minor pseudopilin GspK [bacterium]